MGEQTSIGWCHHTHNPWWGCVRVSPGCEHCYAETFAKRVGQNVWGVQAERRFFGIEHHALPFKWNEKAKAAGERRRVFCASMCDVFEKGRGDVGIMMDAERGRLWITIEATKNLDWLLLTKRPENVMQMVPESWRQNGFPPNVWMGTTAEDQPRLDARIDHLARIPAGIRFLSCEPLLGPLALGLLGVTPKDWGLGYRGIYEVINWVIVGGESGGGARPLLIDWATTIVAECIGADTPVFVKQLGAKPMVDVPHGTRRLALVDRKGEDWTEWPKNLRIRQFPEARA